MQSFESKVLEKLNDGPSAQPIKSKGRPRKDITSTKVGATNQLGLSQDNYMKRYYARRRILEVPEEILRKNPDKHFAYLSMNKLQKSGMWHQLGYRLFKTDSDGDAKINEKFNNGIDGFIHRNEMVLGWIPKEEYDLRQLDEAQVRGRDLAEIISKNPAFNDFHPQAKSKIEIKSF